MPGELREKERSPVVVSPALRVIRKMVEVPDLTPVRVCCSCDASRYAIEVVFVVLPTRSHDIDPEFDLVDLLECNLHGDSSGQADH